MKQCKEIMTKDPTCLNPSDTLQTAANRMKEEDVGSILICDPETKSLSGIVTDRDIVVKAVASGQSLETTLDSIMTTNPVCCREDDDIETAIDLMAEHQVRRLPIVDSENRLVGLISQGDIATRVQEPQKTSEVVEEISKPASAQYQQAHAVS